MNDHVDRLEFAPPPPPGTLRALTLAIIAHLLLLLALTWGVHWKREAENVAAEAELWSSIPEQAAPKVVQAPPPPAPAPPPPEPKVVAPPPPPAPAPKQPDINVEREKKKQELAQRRQEELELKKKLEAKQKREEIERERKLQAQKKLEEQKRLEVAAAQKKAAEEKKKKAEEVAKAAKQEEAKLAALRKENLDRMMKGAAGSGAPTSEGTAARSAGPSDSYAGRVRARVRPNIVFTDDVAGNPKAEVEVRMAPDGTITSRKIVRSSGTPSWDEAVMRALDKTEILPRDVDGRVHTPLIIEFKLKG